MNTQLVKDSIGWGFVLWLIGYILGIVLFFVLPTSIVGWVITPIGVFITLYVLIKKIKSEAIQYYLVLAIAWTSIAIALDYFLIVQLFKPADGYYKPDVYLYYTLTFILPLMVGWRKNSKSTK